MKVIDLTRTIRSGMTNYPGDPEVEIRQIHRLSKQGWRLRVLKLGSHSGTHVDAFSHMDPKGDTLEQMPLTRFFGKAQVVEVGDAYPTQTGLVFREGILDDCNFDEIARVNAPFIAVGDEAELRIALERMLLQAKIVTFTDLINLDRLPMKEIFMFYGFPLNIKDGDGSPIRAVAIVE